MRKLYNMEETGIMKKLIAGLAVFSAMLIAFASCQKDSELPVGPKTHTVTFVADQTVTKTSFELDGSIVNYSWTATDAENDENGSLHFSVYENGVEAESVTAELDGAGLMTITATFADENAPSDAEYVAHFNTGVKPSQDATINDYDAFSDVLVSSKASAGSNGGLQFRFRRASSLGYVKFLGLDEGDFVSSVKIESTDGTTIAAEYDFENGEFISTGSEQIELASCSDIAGQAAFIKFVTVPQESVNLKMTVYTSCEATGTAAEPTLAACYEKELGASLSFSAGDVRAFSVRLTKTASYGNDELEYVDLGLPSGVKWANMNLGANRIEAYGDYFAWGETAPKSSYSQDNYKWNGAFDKYSLTRTVLDYDDDAACKLLSEHWRTPTSEEFKELQENCSYQWTTLNGVNGCMFTGENGNSIFFPAAGSFDGASCSNAGTTGLYSFSDLATESILGPSTNNRFGVLMNSAQVNCTYFVRYLGFSVRPVWSANGITDIALDQTELPLEVGEEVALVATVSSYGETDKSVLWSSSDESVATVDASGNVSAVAVGNATITAETVVGGLSASCAVTVSSSGPAIVAVDLGLPSGLKWANVNVGATKPEEFGDYFAWGEVEPKQSYSESTSTFSKETFGAEDDAATVNMGAGWRMPTNSDWTELKDNCSIRSSTLGDVAGFLVESYENGNSIFIPAAGYYNGSTLYSGGWYWSSTLDFYYSMNLVYCFWFNNNSGLSTSVIVNDRFYGLPIRAVKD